MFWIFIGIIFVTALLIGRSDPASTGYTGKREKTWCPPHKWYWDETGFLKCSLCNNRPQYESRDNNK